MGDEQPVTECRKCGRVRATEEDRQRFYGAVGSMSPLDGGMPLWTYAFCWLLHEDFCSHERRWASDRYIATARAIFNGYLLTHDLFGGYACPRT